MASGQFQSTKLNGLDITSYGVDIISKSKVKATDVHMVLGVDRVDTERDFHYTESVERIEATHYAFTGEIGIDLERSYHGLEMYTSLSIADQIMTSYEEEDYHWGADAFAIWRLDGGLRSHTSLYGSSQEHEVYLHRFAMFSDDTQSFSYQGVANAHTQTAQSLTVKGYKLSTNLTDNLCGCLTVETSNDSKKVAMSLTAVY